MTCLTHPGCGAEISRRVRSSTGHREPIGWRVVIGSTVEAFADGGPFVVHARRYVFGCLALLVSTACSTAPPPPEDGADATGTETAADDGQTADPTPTVEVASWENPDLPAPIGSPAQFGRIVVYLGSDGTDYLLVAVDVLDGEERWRQEVHPHARALGVSETPTIDPETRQVVANHVTDASDADEETWLIPTQVAFDLDDGEPRWDGTGLFAQTHPWRCGEEAFCVIGEGRGHVRSLDGDLRWAGNVGDGRIVGDLDGATLVASEDTVRLISFDRSHLHEHWTVDLTAIPEADRGPWGPGGGWWAVAGEADEPLHLALGHAGPREDLSVTERVERGQLQLRIQDGEVLESWVGGDLCEVEGDVLIFCEDIEVNEFDRPIDGLLADLHATTLVGVDRLTGARWDVALPVPLLTTGWPHRGVAPTTEEGWRSLLLDDGTYRLLDVGSGRVIDPADGPDGILVGCPDPDADHDAFVEVEPVGFEPTSYRALWRTAYLGLCTPDGEPVDIEEVVASGTELPDWFGAAGRVTSDELDEPLVEDDELAERWVLLPLPEGGFRGVGPAPDAG
ncbi:PQQ-like beta-propeller repeat protein [Nitriliruptoraceae bacterium ZYF776]|nr:PQQ-like beta-propeller repeat protein [Profundirhabdus halotolerans]